MRISRIRRTYYHRTTASLACDWWKKLSHLLLFVIVNIYDYFGFTLSIISLEQLRRHLILLCFSRLFKRPSKYFLLSLACRTQTEISSALNWQLLFFPTFARIHLASHTSVGSLALFKTLDTFIISAHRESGLKNPFASSFLWCWCAARREATLDSMWSVHHQLFSTWKSRQTSPNKRFSARRLCCMRVSSHARRASKNESEHKTDGYIFTESVSK